MGGENSSNFACGRGANIMGEERSLMVRMYLFYS